MGKLNEKQILKIIQLTKEGESLNSITNKIGRSKTMVYYHFRKIRGKTSNPICVLNRDDELLGEFMGLFAGDGCVNVTKDYRYRIFLYFNITEKKYVENLVDNVLIKLFGKKPRAYRDDNRLNLCYYSKAIKELIDVYLTWDKDYRKTYSVMLKENNHSREFAIGFLRGSLDSDGHLSYKKIQFASVSTGLIRNISNFLDYLEISHKVYLYIEKRQNRKNIYHINIPKSHHNKFIEIIILEI